MKRKLLKKRCLVVLAGVVACCIVIQLGVNPTKNCHIIVEQTKGIMQKPKLTVPDDINKAIGSDEWISRTITDPKHQCPPLMDENKATVSSNMSCNIPNLDPFHPSMMKLLQDVPMPRCSQRSYGKLVNGNIIFTDPSVVSARYRSIRRQDDFSYALGKSTPVSTAEKITDEFFEVDYLLDNGRHELDFFIQPIPHEHLLKTEARKKPGIPLNVLIIGIDSLSHGNAQRKLPKVYEYLKKDLGAFVFNGHSSVGDGTTEQLAAMLTGKGELEQHEARRHQKDARPVDGWTWIYRELKEHGYLTGFSADAPEIGAFQMRLMGFKDSPTDFYPRPFYLRAKPFFSGGQQCLISRTISKFQFDYIRDVFHLFPRKLKFFFSFNAYSHNGYNEAAKVGPELLALLKDLKQTGNLNNTLLIVMGDHGPRYGEARALLQGKLEERLPLFTMVFPLWFLSRHPTIAANLRTNTDRLTSWYDVYATYRHMLSYPEIPKNLKHGSSLFLEMPETRTCAQANVARHWCPCLEWAAVNTSYSHVQKAALAAVEYMNFLNGKHKKSRIFCEVLTLKSINYALLERPNDKVLSFENTNIDDLRPRFNTKQIPAEKDFCRYQLQFVTSPNNGAYEATVRYYKTWFLVSKSISRVNKYGDQPECIAKDLPHLRKFCLCRRTPDSGHFVNFEKCI